VSIRKVAMVLGVLVVVAGGVGVACTGAGSGAGDAGGVAGGGAGDASGGAGGGAEPAARTGGSNGRLAEVPSARSDFAVRTVGGARSAVPLPRLGPSIIKSAEVEIGVPQNDLNASVQSVTDIAGGLGGFVASTSIDARDGRRGTVVLRVPSARFEEALRQLRDLGKVRHEAISGVDVSQEFVDLQARLRNWQAQEAVLLRLMDRARSVVDTIRVQGELSRVQLEIERLRGRLSYLEDQTDLGTITAAFVGTGPAAPGRPTTLARAWQQATRAALGVVSGVIVGAGYLVPLALLAGIAALVLRGLRPRLWTEPRSGRS
jgi:hypothetical protein